MIPIPEQFSNCSLYIYKNKADAETGEKSGGSGFLVAIPLIANPEMTQLYAVTARHVVADIPNPVLRLNTLSGTFDLLETNRQRWIWHDDDVAVYPIDLDPEIHKFAAVSLREFVTEETVHRFFPGDEVFMVGRFVSHEGTQQNKPSVRFGNISMMPGDPMQNKYGHPQASFLVEQRSLPGYSGSPVFTLIDPTSPRPPMWLTPVNHPFRPDWHGPFLLGIDWCHLHNYEEVLTEDRDTKADPKRWVKAHTGMAGVIPAWRLAAILEADELRSQREAEDKRISAQRNGSSLPTCAEG